MCMESNDLSYIKNINLEQGLFGYCWKVEQVECSCIDQYKDI